MVVRRRLPREYRRYRVFLFFSAFFGYGCYIINRASYTTTIPAITEESGYEKDQLGFITSSFALAYATSKVLFGILSDKLSPTTVFACGLAVSGILNILFGMTKSLHWMVGLWLVNGLAQGAGWPPVAKLIRNWVLDHEAGRWWSTISISMNLAAGLQALTSGTIILFWGWRFVFYVSGVIAFGISVFILSVTKDSPREVGLLTLDELESKKQEAKQKKGKHSEVAQQTPKWSSVFFDYFLLMISAGYLLVYAIRVALADAGWGQLYLIQEKHISKLEAADARGSFELGGMIGSLLVGFVSDFLVMKFPTVGAHARVPALCFCTAVLAMALHILIFSETLTRVWVAGIFFALGACVYGPISIFGMLAVQNAPKGLEGTAHSVAAFSAQVGAILSGFPFGYVATHVGWKPAMLTLEVAAVTVTVAFTILTINKIRHSTREKVT